MPKAKTTSFEEEKEGDVTKDVTAGPAQLPESRWLGLSLDRIRGRGRGQESGGEVH